MCWENVVVFCFVLIRYRFLLIIWLLFLSFVLLHVPLNPCTSHINAETKHLVGFDCFLVSYSAAGKWLDCLEVVLRFQCRSWSSNHTVKVLEWAFQWIPIKCGWGRVQHGGGVACGIGVDE